MSNGIRVLVIEDEADLRTLLSYNLEAWGYQVRAVETGKAGLKSFDEFTPDLVLLDLMLPDISGLEVCRSLKSNPATRAIPVVMVTAKSAEVDRVVGFELGADDYVVKPFSVRELLLRVQAVLRRSQPAPAPPPVAPLPTPAITFGRLRIDRDAPNVQVDDQDVSLTALELRLLCTLYERRNRVQSRAVLLDDVWCVSGENATRTVDTHVKRLREKLGPVGAYIETIRGIGYRFIGAPPKQPP
jgi:two-component system, OmpR family, phosphate regulon response regulator PhoB